LIFLIRRVSGNCDVP